MAEKNDEKPDTDAQRANKIKDSARQIWLAGLGAYTKAEEDAGRFFDRLVHEGEEIESKTRSVVEKQVKSVEHRVDDVRGRATGTWDKLEHMFDERVSGALRRLGFPRQGDIDAMEQRIAALEKEVKQLKSAQRKEGTSTKSKPAQK